MSEFSDKLRTLQFAKVITRKVVDRETGRVLGEQHYHINGSVGATVHAEVGNASVQAQEL